MEKLLSDIFSMRFDIIIPLSSCLIAVALAGVLFSIRYFSYRKNKRKYEKRQQQEAQAQAAADDTGRPPGKGEAPGG